VVLITRVENIILDTLFEAFPHSVKLSCLFENIWGDCPDQYNRNKLSVHMSNLRRKARKN